MPPKLPGPCFSYPSGFLLPTIPPPQTQAGWSFSGPSRSDQTTCVHRCSPAPRTLPPSACGSTAQSSQGPRTPACRGVPATGSRASTDPWMSGPCRSAGVPAPWRERRPQRILTAGGVRGALWPGAETRLPRSIPISPHPQEKLKFFPVCVNTKPEPEDEAEEGLGGLPSNISSVSSLLLFNTTENL